MINTNLDSPDYKLQIWGRGRNNITPIHPYTVVLELEVLDYVFNKYADRQKKTV